MNWKINLIVLAVLMILFLLAGPFYTLDETKQSVITQLGEPIGDPITEAGLYFKIPFIQTVHLFEKRILQWDGDPESIPTADKKYIWVDTMARWRIADALKFYKSVGDEVGAQARLDDILDSTVRDLITNHRLLEVVRTSNEIFEREEATPDVDELDIEFEEEYELGEEERIRVGREEITHDILETATAGLMANFGIELIDVQIKHINYVEDVRKKVYDRMISERKRIAEKYRSQGQGKLQEWLGRKEEELKRITSEAYKQAEEIKGEADGEATRIYAEAYSIDPDFYTFFKTLESYRETINPKTRLILTTKSDYYKHLKDSLD